MKKKLVSAVLALALCLGLLPGAYAAPTAGPTVSSNQNRQDYTTWSSPVRSYLYANPSGGLTRVEYVNGNVVIEDYSSAFQLQSSRTVPMELPLWGGFYAGENFNFLIFGQKNDGESDGVEVIRVVKYDKSWNRLGQASLSGANTKVPFDGGSLRCDEYNGYLYLRTCHTMYKSGDGYNHQSNMTIAVNQDSMAVSDSYYEVMNQSYGYVSHSFNQFILVDGDGRLVAVDHGDAYPRGISFCRYYADAGTGRFRGSTYSPWCSYTTLCKFAGATGANTTGASVGGLAETRNGYVLCYNYDGAGGSGERSVYYHWINKSGGQSWALPLTQGSGSTTPVMASLGQDGGYILWNGKSGYTANDTLYYMSFDGGGAIGQVMTARGSLSDCQPIAYNGKAVWYATSNSVPTFYTLDAAGVTATPAGGTAVSGFSDVPANHWAYGFVKDCTDQGVVNGVGGGRFNPNGNVTYAQFAKMLATAFRPAELAQYHVLAGGKPWYWEYMQAAGPALFAGTAVTPPAGSGGPIPDSTLSAWANAPMSRYDMAAMAFNTLGMWSDGVSDPGQDSAYLARLTDESAIPAGSRGAIAACMRYGIINGIDGAFSGGSNMTRAQSCKVMVTLMEAVETLRP